MLARLAALLAGPALATLLGGGLITALGALRQRSIPIRLVYAFLVGEATLTISLWALSFRGWIHLDRTGVFRVAGGILLLTLAVALLQRRRARGESSAFERNSEGPRRQRFRAPLWLLAAVALFTAGTLANTATDLPSDFDGRMTWATQARYLAAEGSVLPTALTDARYYVTHPRYPILMPIAQVVSASLVREQLVPFSARPLYALFYPAILALAFDGARRLAGRSAAAFSTLLAAVATVLATQPEGGAASLYSDLPLGCFLGAGLLLATERRFVRAHAALAGLLFAAALLCKNEGVVLATCAFAATLAASAVGRFRKRELIARALAMFVPLAFAANLLFSWRARIPNRFDERFFESFSPTRILAALPNLLAPAREAAAMLVRFEDWGLFWPIAAGALLLGARALRRRPAWPLLFSIAPALLIAGMAYALNPDLGLVRVTFHRFLIQILLPILVLFSMLLRESSRRLRRWGSFAVLERWRAALADWQPSRPVSQPAAAWTVAALSLALTVAFLPGAVRGFATAVGPDWGDPLLNLYFLKWGAAQISLGMPDFWTAPFFYPTRGTMTLSDHLLGPAAVTWLAGLVGVGPVAAYNGLLLLTFAATCFTTAWVVRRSGIGWGAALFAGIAVAFGHFRLDQLSHLQVLLMPWIPLALWSFDRLLARPSATRAALFFLFYALQITGGTYLAYMLHFPLAILAANRLVDRGSRQAWRDRRAGAILAMTAALCAALALSLFLPYLRYAPSLGIRREAADIVPFAAVTWSWLTPTARSALDTLSIGPPYRGENGLFPGFLPLLLTGLGLPLLWRTVGGPRATELGRRSRVLLVAGAALTAVGLALADFHTLTGRDGLRWLRELGLRRYNGPSALFFLGLILTGCALWIGRRTTSPPCASCEPSNVDRIWLRGLLAAGLASTLLAHPVVFFALRSWVPGMDGMRVPQRFWAFALPALALAAGVGLDAVTNALRSSAARRLVPLAACALLATELAPKSFEWTPVASQTDLPRSSQFLRDEPAVRGVLVLPLFGDHREAERMWLASFHGKPIANGYSGFLPASYRALQERFDPFPVPDDLHDLRRLGLSHLEVHWDLLEASTRHLAFERISAAERAGVLKVVFEEEPVVVYVLPDD